MVTKSRHDIQSKEIIFTIIWSSSGFYVIDRFPNDIKMNSDYFVTNMLIPLKQAIFSRWRPPHQKPLVIHLDNCSVHISPASTDWFEEYGMRRMPCLLYLSDLALVTSTCFLQWKKNSNRFRWLTRTSFLSPCKRFWRYRSRRIECIFQAWVQRVQEVSQGNGDTSDDR
jgi:hypothetical protein